jgi:hypothetical protein
MTVVTGFSRFGEVAANPAFIIMPSSSIGIALWTLAIGHATWLAYPIGIRLLLLFKDGIVVVPIAIEISNP